MVHIKIGLLNDLTSITLTNEVLELTVLPQTGARIYSIVHKPSQTEFLWHHPQNTPRLHQTNEMFDDVFPGGWDELFPTCDPCQFNGLDIPDHGELWSKPWEWKFEDTNEGCLNTAITAQQFPIKFERRLYLQNDEASFRLHYRLENLSSESFKLIWGIHPLFQISPHHRLDLSGGEMLVALSSDEVIGKVGQTYLWPFLPTGNTTRDMRIIPNKEAHLSAGHYCTKPSGNWFALTDIQKKVGLAMIYPPEIFRSMWIWQSYGEWQGLYHLAVEPWAGYPVKLDEAEQAGRTLEIKGHQCLEYQVSVIISTQPDTLIQQLKTRS